jgi:hypothetical protein
MPLTDKVQEGIESDHVSIPRIALHLFFIQTLI